MAHTQNPYFVFWQNRQVHLNQRGCQFSRLLAAVVCASAVVMLDTPHSEVVCRVLATHSIRQFSLHFPSRVSPCAITFQLYSTTFTWMWGENFYSIHHLNKVLLPYNRAWIKHVLCRYCPGNWRLWMSCINFFMAVPCIDDLKFFISSTNAYILY
jgi:hypothetical protein